MEPVKIEPYRTLREGITFAFRGCEPDAEGAPAGEFIEIELVVPPLNLDSLKALGAKLLTYKGVGLDDLDTVRLSLAHALRRNYRGVPDWLIGQTLDIGNMQELFVALMDVSGLKRKEIEAGKAKAAAAVTESSTGTSSTPT